MAISGAALPTNTGGFQQVELDLSDFIDDEIRGATLVRLVLSDPDSDPVAISKYGSNSLGLVPLNALESEIISGSVSGLSSACWY